MKKTSLTPMLWRNISSLVRDSVHHGVARNIFDKNPSLSAAINGWNHVGFFQFVTAKNMTANVRGEVWESIRNATKPRTSA